MATNNNNNTSNPEVENANSNINDATSNEELENLRKELDISNEKNKKLEEEKEELRKELDKFKEKNKSKVVNSNGKKVYEVTTPVNNFCGVVAGVHFAYGKAEVIEGHILNWFIEKGYKVKEIK